MVRAEDAAKISRIVDKFELATIDTKALRESINANQKAFENISKLTDEQHNELVNNLQKELQNPAFARKEKSDSLSEHTSNTVADRIQKRSSVKKELLEIKNKKSDSSKDKTVIPKLLKKERGKIK